MATQAPPSARPSFRADLLQIPAERVQLETSDGQSIAALWSTPEEVNGKPPVVVLHGFGASKEHMINYVLLARREGFPVLALDFRGHGDSSDSLVSFGHHERNDVLAALDFLSAAGYDHAVLWGTSMGAVTALLTASQYPERVAAVIADAPFDTLRNTLAHHARYFFGLGEFPLLTLTYLRMEQRLGMQLEAVDALDAASRLDMPVMIIAAEMDERMPVDLVRGIYDALPGPKSWFVIPGEGHEYRAFDDDFCSAVNVFLNSSCEAFAQ